MKNILIRADGSKEIGMGHLRRAYSIGSEFIRRGYKPVILMKEDVNGLQFLLDRKVDNHCLSQSLSIDDELREVYKLILSNLPCVFILDILYHDEYQALLTNLKKEQCLSVVITDESKKTTIKADIVLNGNPHQLDYDYTESPEYYLMGPQYFIMDSSYEDVTIDSPKQKKKLNLFITVGGSDHNDLLFNVLEALGSVNVNFGLSIFVTSTTGYKEKLISFLDNSDLETQLYVDQETLAPFWETCDLAITAAGNTLFERIAARLPGATVCQLPRQMNIANCLEKLGVNVNLGLGIELSVKTLSEKIETFMCDIRLQEIQYERSPTITRGRGLSYLIKAIDDS